MFLGYSFSTLNEYYILFSILCYPNFCQPWIISEQNSKRVSKDRLRKQLLHMKFPYTRYGYELGKCCCSPQQDQIPTQREAGYTIVYTDETYVHTSHTVP